ncbi:alpha/beta hydrolase [Candidatus Pelagibacter sp.]|nr:alpha/beta hydrolase [Candidatus Pelagibacter sp.]
MKPSLIKNKIFKNFGAYFLQFILTIFVIYFLVLVFLYFYQRSLLYHPNENNYSGDKISVDIEKVKIQTSDNIKLLGWYHEKNLKDYKTLVYFHGNAGSLENRIHKLNHFQDMNINFLIVAWRGFNGNKGKPSEKGLYVDGKSTIDWLIKKGVDEKNLILYGESLGTGVASHLAQNKNYAGVILETPFTSMIDAAKNFYPYIPVNLLLKDKFENYKKVKNINSPILIMHGEVDQIVPFSMGKKIYELANNPKYSYFTKYDNHMMEYDENLILALKSFFKSLN